MILRDSHTVYEMNAWRVLAAERLCESVLTELHPFREMRIVCSLGI